MSPIISTTVTTVPARYPPSHTTPPTHHVGSPPKAFKNPWPSTGNISVITAFKKIWGLEKNFIPVPEDRAGLVSVRAPDFGVDSNGLKATWIGHASFLIETTRAEGAERGMRILLDPVWSDRVGPYSVVGPVRFTPPPCTVEELPEVDAVCISHDHYDHLDLPTIRSLYAKQKGDIRFFCGLGIKSTLLGFGIGIKAEQIHEMDWWESVRLERNGVAGIDLVCSPAQHQSGRVPWGFNSTLWCSWVVAEPGVQGKKLFFAGDTGYCHVNENDQFSHHDAPHPPCPAFVEIGELHGPFDLALLPIGCFKPRTVMSTQHSSPEDSLSIHKNIKSKKSVGMHYGVFRGQLSAQFEPVTEPCERWRKGAEAEGLKWGEQVGLCDVGETVIV